MVRTRVVMAAAAGAALLAGTAAESHALTSSAVLTPFTGNPVTLNVTLDDSVGGGRIQFTLETSPDSDITGFYFHISDESLLSGLSIVPNTAVTEFTTDANNVNTVRGMYNNMNGGGAANPGRFDAGVAIGTQGAGGGDFFPSVSFVLQHSSVALTLDHFAGQIFGARIQSIGGDGGPSARLKGVGGEAVPEPVTAGLSMISLAALAMATRRRQHC